MPRWEMRFQHLANLLTAGSGLIYAYYRYFSKASDSFSNANPGEPLWHNLHLLWAPTLVFACGLIWKNHVWKKLQAPRASQRISGIAMVCVIVPMIATGSLIQMAVDDLWRKIFVAVHLVTSAAWLVSYVIHYLRLKSSPKS